MTDTAPSAVTQPEPAVDARETCQAVRFERHWPHRCHRPAVEEYQGKWLCKLHLNGARRREANTEKFNREFEERRTRLDVASSNSRQLTAQLGTPVQPYYTKNGWQSDKMVVDTAFLESLTAGAADREQAWAAGNDVGLAEAEDFWKERVAVLQKKLQQAQAAGAAAERERCIAVLEAAAERVHATGDTLLGLHYRAAASVLRADATYDETPT